MEFKRSFLIGDVEKELSFNDHYVKESDETLVLVKGAEHAAYMAMDLPSSNFRFVGKVPLSLKGMEGELSEAIEQHDE